MKSKNLFILSAFSFLASVIFLPDIGQAYNLKVQNVTLTTPNASAGTVKIQFDISWSGSWRYANDNRDAVWVFAKYSTDSGSSWAHCTLKTAGTNPTGTSAGTLSTLDIIIPTDKKGAIIERSAEGVGDIDADSVQLTWDNSTDGVTSGSARVQVFAIEMTYIPAEAFYIGDGDSSYESSSAFHVTDNVKVQITSSLTANIKVDTNANDDSGLESTGIGLDGDGGLDTDNNGSLDNASFPTGYTAFYLMKYELTEGQWVAFFNTLSSGQKTARDITSSSGKNSDSSVNRNTISWSSGDATTTRSLRAMHYISWMDLMGYADWAGLRPMTEVEYEKACRGPVTYVPAFELPWGYHVLTGAEYWSNNCSSISGSEDGTEYCSRTTYGNWWFWPRLNVAFGNLTYSGGDGSTGPLRVGIFAAGGGSRYEMGTGYYGNQELGGNVWEKAVTLGSSTGRAFAGTHGDGTLTSTGLATNSDWPGYSSGAVSGASGSGSRGSAYDQTASATLCTSNRAAMSTLSTRSAGYGGRLARTVS